MELTVTEVDYAPRELQDQVPFVIRPEREMAGDDRPDYWLGAMATPLRWITENHERKITPVVIAARWEGTAVEPGVTHLPIGIAYVTDPTLLSDDRLAMSKCVYVAIGLASDTTGGSAVQKQEGIQAKAPCRRLSKGGS